MVLASRMMSRRYVVMLTVFGVFMGAFLVASRRLGDLCPDGSYCGDLTRLRHKTPTITTDHGLPSETSVIQHEESPVNHEQGDSAQDDAGDDAPDGDKSQGDEVTDGETQDTTTQDPNNPNVPVLDEGAHSNTIHNTTGQNSTAQVLKNPDCAHFPDTSNILLVMKTGATEAYNKIPVQIMTNLKCLPEYFIFSDMEQRIAGHQIYDSLDTVLTDVKMNNDDFELYFRQQSCPVEQEGCNKGTDSGSQAWSLDKYKNIHIAEKTYHMRPDYDWYLFVDADTYVVWPTMVEWLKQLDPSERHYLGSVAMLDGFGFAHGGSGYLASRATMAEFLEGKSEVANGWDQRAKGECCGDYLFAKALNDNTGIGVQNVWPTINGEKPHTMPYNDEEWCQPIATMHHMSAEEVSEMDAFERARDFSSPMRIKDLYHRFFEQQLGPERADWDNMSDDVMYLNATAAMYEDWQVDRAKKEYLTELEAKAHLSVEDCREACLSLDYCYQYRFFNGICGTTHKFKHGAPKRSDDDSNRWMSGWDVDKIRAWVDEHGECGDVQWPMTKFEENEPEEDNFEGNQAEQNESEEQSPEQQSPEEQSPEENSGNTDENIEDNSKPAGNATENVDQKPGNATVNYDANAMSEEKRRRRRRWAR